MSSTMAGSDAPGRDPDRLRGSRALHRYNVPSGADDYARKYSRSRSRARTDRREQSILAGMLRRTSGDVSLLNVACGAGRFSRVIDPARRARVVYADSSAAMLRLASQRVEALGAGGVVFRLADVVRDSADEVFETVLCVRLLHHFKSPALVEAALDFLCGSCRSTLIVTFATTSTWKGLWRALRERSGRRRGERIESLASVRRRLRARGFRVRRIRFVSRLFSTQTWVLAERDPPAPTLCAADRETDLGRAMPQRS